MIGMSFRPTTILKENWYCCGETIFLELLEWTTSTMIFLWIPTEGNIDGWLRRNDKRKHPITTNGKNKKIGVSSHFQVPGKRIFPTALGISLKNTISCFRLDQSLYWLLSNDHRWHNCFEFFWLMGIL